MRSSLIVVLVACALSAPACTEGDPHTWETHVPPITVGVGEEVLGLCYSWTLENEEPLYVNAVDFATTPGTHHSNWVYVPDTRFRGPDGVWPCSDREFVKEAVPLLDGGVLFAQSTQSVEDSQTFLPGVVLALPPRVRIIGDLHLLNYGATPVDVEMSLTVHSLPPEEVVTKLSPLVLDYSPLEIQPRGRSEFTTDCDLDTPHQAGLGRPLDFNIHYILPHYHNFGDLLQVQIIGGPRDGEVIAETRNMIGEPLAITFPEPVSMLGAQGLRLRCGYQNPTDEMIYYGNAGGEMCIAVGYTDSPSSFAGITLGENVIVGMEGDVTQNTTDCEAFSMESTHTRLGI
jgi:hypothetical protein